MKTNTKIRQPSGSAIAFIEIQGDKRNPEPEAYEIRFPWGVVGVVRATDTERPDYWVHVTRNHRDAGLFVPSETEEGRIVDARLDVKGKDVNKTDCGDFGNKDLYHLAVRIGPSVKT